MKQSPEIRLIRRSSNWSLDFYWRPYEGAKLKRKIVAVARTKELAKPFRKELLDALEAGTFTGVMPWKIPASKNPELPTTFGGVADRWLATKIAGKNGEGTVKPSTRKFYEFQKDRLVEHFGADRAIETITESECEEFYNGLLRAGASRAKAKNAVVALKQITKAAHRWKIIPENPALYVKVKRVPNREDVLTKAEAALIISHADDWAQAPLRAIKNTDSRRGDILGNTYGRTPLHWDQVDLKGRVITFTNTKEGQARYVAINSELCKLLSGLDTRLKGGPVFVAPLHKNARIMAPPKPERVLQALKRGAKRAGFTRCNVTIHLLRHSATTWMAQGGAGRLAGEVAGHRDIKTTERYTHMNVDDQRAAVEMLGG